jgi:hypothetical protein
MPHTDGPLYFPYVTIMSLNSHCMFKFYENYQQYKDGNHLCILINNK